MILEPVMPGEDEYESDDDEGHEEDDSEWKTNTDRKGNSEGKSGSLFRIECPNLTGKLNCHILGSRTRKMMNVYARE